MMLNEEEFYDAVETALDKHDEEDGETDDLVTKTLNTIEKNSSKLMLNFSLTP
jgi:aminopeptidase N